MKPFLKSEKFKISLPEFILIALMSAMNVGFDLLLSTPLKILLSHVIAGIFFMVPINFIFISFTKLMADKHGTITIYLIIFGILSIPTAMFGGIAGAYKIVVGGIIGICLDLLWILPNQKLKIIIGSIFGSIFWWVCLFMVWELFKLPFVTGFSSLLNSASENFAGSIDLSRIINLPVTGFGWDFLAFAILCGLMSAVPCLIASFIGFGFFNKVKKTALYEKFKSMH